MNEDLHLSPELSHLLSWAFESDEGLDSTWDGVWEKAQELECVEELAQLGWAMLVTAFFESAMAFQNELDEQARKSEWEL